MSGIWDFILIGFTGYLFSFWWHPTTIFASKSFWKFRFMLPQWPQFSSHCCLLCSFKSKAALHYDFLYLLIWCILFSPAIWYDSNFPKGEKNKWRKIITLRLNKCPYLKQHKIRLSRPSSWQTAMFPAPTVNSSLSSFQYYLWTLNVFIFHFFWEERMLIAQWNKWLYSINVQYKSLKILEI